MLKQQAIAIYKKLNTLGWIPKKVKKGKKPKA